MAKQQKNGRFKEFLNQRSRDIIQRQQLITYLIATAMVIVGMNFHLFNVLGSKMPALRTLSIICLVMCVTNFCLWLFRKISLRSAYAAASIIVQAIQTAKIIFIAHSMPASYAHLIVMNALISMMLMILLGISYMHIASAIVGGINLITLIGASLIIENHVMWQYTILLSLFTIFFILMSNMMYHNVKVIRDENKKWQKDEQRLLHILRLNRKEIKSYVEMCRNENPDDGETDRLFGMLSEKAQRNVINAVERKKALDASRSSSMKDIFPDFTPMEIEVARMIVRGMKLSQIINLTGKTESNISVVRSRIRKKLNLTIGQDLRTALMEKMGDLEDIEES